MADVTTSPKRPYLHDLTHRNRTFTTLPASRPLCHLCSAVTAESLTSPDGYSHAKDIATAGECASKCLLCMHVYSNKDVASWAPILAKNGTEDQSSASSRPWKTYKLQWKTEVDDIPRAYLYYETPLRKGITTFRIYTITGDEAATRYGIPVLDDCVDTSSDFAMSLARNWLDYCEANHASCSTKLPFLNSDSWPTRLLDVVTAYPDPILEEIPLEKMNGKKYAALSHCWGPSGIPVESKAMSQSIPALPKKLSHGSLARNFQHAIDVAYKLGFAYLWIDALCIFQDSSSDWEKEAAKMGGIYGSAALTIAIQCSPDAHHGCFANINTFPSGTYQATSTLRSGLTSTLRFDIPEENDSIRHGNLMRRAWCMQEHILSPRVLHYTKNGIIWECRQGCWNERSKARRATIGCSSGLHLATKRPTVPDEWYEIIEDYTARSLSYRSDVLPAISAIARAIGWQTGHRYLAGIWVEDLAFGLSWTSGGDIPEPIWTEDGLLEGAVNRPTSNTPSNPFGIGLTINLPSWSWAAHKFQVNHDIENRAYAQPTLQLINSQITYASSDPYAGIRNAVLRVKAPVGTATLIRPDLPGSSLRGYRLRLHISASRTYDILSGSNLELDYMTTSQRVALLRIMEFSATRKAYCKIQHLVLRGIRTKDSRGRNCVVYQRIGSWSTTLPGQGKERWWHSMKSTLSRKAATPQKRIPFSEDVQMEKDYLSWLDFKVSTLSLI